MLDSWSLAVLGFVQGATEFLPVSSSGHLIIARDLFHFSPEFGLAIDAVLQLATALAIVVYFWSDILRLLKFEERATSYAILIGTVPALIAGLLIEDIMATLFRSAELVAYALLAGSALMLVAEYGPKYRGVYAERWWFEGVVVGCFQALALIPGMSRSGMTIVGGMLIGRSRADAARFGFLLAIPILLGSGLKKLMDLGVDGTLATVGPALFVGAVVSFVSGLLAIYVLLALVRRTPLTVFVVYRVLLAALILWYVQS
ncbi:MAG: undecaprenyl-diphosphatase UppP [Candidatus Pacebacteria bacterium]|nr:undecaprenyl-diphosphatase UppP [Candidatus Paceibacterota bacterium]